MAEADTANNSGDALVQGVMNVTKDDQQKINQFAKLNARFEDVKDDITSKTNLVKNYKDALSEAEIKMLEDESDKLHLQIGQFYANLSYDEIQEWLEEKSKSVEESIEELEKKKAEIVDEMTKLKAHLYARFGNNIHLESGP